MTAFPKTAYVRSKALMTAYRTIPCQNCGADDQTVCGAHSNASEHGKGRSIKASDDKCASLCHRCHTALDQGSEMSREERVRMWTEAHEKTMRALIERSHEDWRLRETLRKVGIVK